MIVIGNGSAAKRQINYEWAIATLIYGYRTNTRIFSLVTHKMYICGMQHQCFQIRNNICNCIRVFFKVTNDHLREYIFRRLSKTLHFCARVSHSHIDMKYLFEHTFSELISFMMLIRVAARLTIRD